MSLANVTSTRSQGWFRALAVNGELKKTATFHTIAMAVFTVAIFNSATLLFVIQPMVGKLLLPKLGGAPAVWNTCMLFFQATLLAGYLAAHLVTRYFPLAWQVSLYVSGLSVAFFTLPIAIDPQSIESLIRGSDPNGWLLHVLVTRVAPVFLMLSVTSPLLQHWFGKLGHPHGNDPYFLYSASNIGSILSLLLFPFVLEVTWRVQELATIWTWGFGFFIPIAAICGLLCVKTNHGSASESKRTLASLSWKRRGYWIILSLIPSSLMLGVTTYISTDVSSVPLIWIIPLTIYLLTFVLAFARKQWFNSYWMGRIAALLIVVIMVTVITGGNDPPSVIIPLHLLMFSTVAMFCHQRLAADRPESGRLTEFYLCMSIGGVLGGLCNAIVAPLLFSTIFEYPCMMTIATLFRETKKGDFPERSKFGVVCFGAAIFALVVGISYIVQHVLPPTWIESISLTVGLPAAQIETLICFGPPACWLFSQIERRISFSIGLSAMLLVSVGNRSIDARILEQGRNFYGTLETNRIKLDGQELIRMLHGNTVHGCQWTHPSKRGIPLTYYGPRSGISQLIHARQAMNNQPMRIGAIGLGAGSLAAWCRPSDTIVFYEINPLVVDHAERHFSYLSEARKRGVKVEVRTGDARLLLESEMRAPDIKKYDLMIVDAFSSDSIPVHLITEEACALYCQSLFNDGVLSFHISNRFLDLEPVLARHALKSGWKGFRYNFTEIQATIEPGSGETSSSWVVIVRDENMLGKMSQDQRLQKLRDLPGHRTWTDDFSNLLSVFKIRL